MAKESRSPERALSSPLECFLWWSGKEQEKSPPRKKRREQEAGSPGRVFEESPPELLSGVGHVLGGHLVRRKRARGLKSLAKHEVSSTTIREKKKPPHTMENMRSEKNDAPYHGSPCPRVETGGAAEVRVGEKTIALRTRHGQFAPKTRSPSTCPAA